MLKKAFSLIIAALFALTLCIPALALIDAQPKYPTPAGYNDNDYQKLVAFLELEDENGVKNGEKISPIYAPEDPGSWDYYEYDNMDIVFSEFDNEMRAYILAFDHYDLVGPLDLSGCSQLLTLFCSNNRLTSVNVDGCTGLFQFGCSANGLAELDVSSCTALEMLRCPNNELCELDITHNPDLFCLECDENRLAALDLSCSQALGDLRCSGNELTELDVTGCPNLEWLLCGGNPLTVLDLSQNSNLGVFDCFETHIRQLDLTATQMYFQMLFAYGNGTVAVTTVTQNYTIKHVAAAQPNQGEVFLGWYDFNGDLVSEEPFVNEIYLPGRNLYALFTSVLPGDVDDDGEITVADALLTMRNAMGLIEADPEAADVDGDGEVTVADALLVMRAAMGLITLD